MKHLYRFVTTIWIQVYLSQLQGRIICKAKSLIKLAIDLSDEQANHSVIPQTSFVCVCLCFFVFFGQEILEVRGRTLRYHTSRLSRQAIEILMDNGSLWIWFPMDKVPLSCKLQSLSLMVTLRIGFLVDQASFVLLTAVLTLYALSSVKDEFSFG